MPYRIQCSAGHKLVIPERWAGTTFHCPKCGAAVAVPGEAKKPVTAALNTVMGAPVSGGGSLVVHAAEPTVSEVAQQSATKPVNEITTVYPTMLLNAWVPDAAKRATAWHLGLLIMAVALFSVSPAAWEWMAIWQHPTQIPVPPWVYMSLLTGTVLFAYGVFVAQLPDWSALGLATGALLCTATFYATLLATTLLGTDETSLVVLLKYGDKLAGNRAGMWCFVMLCISCSTAYFLGHSALRWYNAYWLLRQYQQQHSEE